MKIHSFILGIFLILCLNVNAQHKLEIEGCYFNSKNIEFKAKFPSKFKNLCNPNRTISHYITSQGHDIFYLKPPYYIIHPIHLTSEKYIGEVVDSLNDIIRKEIFMDVQREMKYTTIYKFINTYSKKNNNGKYSFDYLYGEHIASYFVSSQYDWVVDIKESELNDALTFLKDKIYFYEVSIKNKLKNNNKSDEDESYYTNNRNELNCTREDHNEFKIIGVMDEIVECQTMKMLVGVGLEYSGAMSILYFSPNVKSYEISQKILYAYYLTQVFSNELDAIGKGISRIRYRSWHEDSDYKKAVKQLNGVKKRSSFYIFYKKNASYFYTILPYMESPKKLEEYITIMSYSEYEPQFMEFEKKHFKQFYYTFRSLRDGKNYRLHYNARNGKFVNYKEIKR